MGVFSPNMALYLGLYHVSIACDLSGALISGSLNPYSIDALLTAYSIMMRGLTDEVECFRSC